MATYCDKLVDVSVGSLEVEVSSVKGVVMAVTEDGALLGANLIGTDELTVLADTENNIQIYIMMIGRTHTVQFHVVINFTTI